MAVTSLLQDCCHGHWLPIFRRYALPLDASLEGGNSGYEFPKLVGFAYFYKSLLGP